MGINRRKFLKSVGLGTIMLGAQPLTALASEALVSDSSSQDRKDITDDGPQVQIGDHIAIAKIVLCLLVSISRGQELDLLFFMEIQRLKMYIVVHPLHMICSLIIGTMMRSVKIVFA